VRGSNRRQDRTLDEDLNDPYSLSNILRVMKSEWMSVLVIWHAWEGRKMPAGFW
jgi:hypothetical protein